MLNENPSSIRIAIIGSGPAGIYAADCLLKSEISNKIKFEIDLYDKMPTPFGLIRYGVAPDHPRIKGIIDSLHRVMQKPELNFFGNINFGPDISLTELKNFYDAIIIATGAVKDKKLTIPGTNLTNCFGAADFVGWYDGNPDFARTWSLTAARIAILGVGNVALDIARILGKTAQELLTTEIPANVHAGLNLNQAKEIHIFGRKDPTQAKFTPLELKELSQSANIEVIVSPEDIEYDEVTSNFRRESKIVDQVCQILEHYAFRENLNPTARKIFIHFFESPIEILGTAGKVIGLKTERTKLDGAGKILGTNIHRIWNVDAVYRAIGYESTSLPNLPFDEKTATIPHIKGRINVNNQTLPALYVTGWIKRGPVGLIGNTKSDAQETITSLLEDYHNNKLLAAPQRNKEQLIEFLQTKKIKFTTWEGWIRLDQHEKILGITTGRERIKVVEREEMVNICNSN